MGDVRIQPPVLLGLSFSIADLILTGAWARASGLRMQVCLDYQSPAGDYEEVLAFFPEHGGPCRFVVWRNLESVYVLPITGRISRHVSAAEALETIAPAAEDTATDLVAPHWPDDLAAARECQTP